MPKLEIGNRVQSNENLTGTAWINEFQLDEILVPIHSIGTVTGVDEKCNRVYVDMDCRATLEFEPMRSFDIVIPFAGFAHDNSCYNRLDECFDILLYLWDIDEYLRKRQEIA